MMADHTRVQHALSALSTHAVETFCRGSTLPEAGFLSHFLDNLPRLPVHTLNLATKCLQEETSIQEVVAEIKAHPALAAAVLTTINSAYYGLSQKSKPSTTPASC
jgi:HDOD domain